MAETKGFNLADALASVPKTDTGEERLERIDIDRLFDDPNNFYSMSDLDGLAETIELIGLQQPVRVRPDPGAPGNYIIVSGHRRRAAIQMLVNDGREDLRRIPCIVEQPAESEAMQELRLIFANSGTRRLTDPELAAQADRVTELLYKLKEEGVEFPGRMRDHVAEACQVSKSKLARLKVIETGLRGELHQLWLEGKVNESAAYALARMPEELQYRINGVTRGKVPDGGTLEHLLKRNGAGCSWMPAALTCPDGKPCSHAKGFLAHALDRPGDEACDGTKCCLDCHDGATCDYYSCTRMCSRAVSAKKRRKSDEKAKAERAEERRITKIQKASIPYARRIAHAADAAGLPDDVRLNWDYSSFTLGQIRQWADGVFSDSWPSYWPVQLMPENLGHPLAAAKTLQCSADYLLGLTDELHPAASPRAYITDHNPEAPTEAVGLFDLGDNLGLYRTFVIWDGKGWVFPFYASIDGPCVGWYPIPETPGESVEETPDDQEETPDDPEEEAPEEEAQEANVPEDINSCGVCSIGISPSGICRAAAKCTLFPAPDCCGECDEDCDMRCEWLTEEDKHE